MSNPGASAAASVHPLRRLWQYAGPYRGRVRWAVLWTLLNKLFDVLPELLIGVAVDVVVRREASWLSSLGITSPYEQLGWLAGVTVVVWVLESGCEYLYEIAWRKLAQSLQHDVRMDVYRHLQQLDIAYFEDRQSGALLSVLSEDIHQLERFVNNGISQLLQVATGTLLCSVAFVGLAPTTTMYLVLPIPFIIYGAYWFQRRLRPKYSAVRERAASLAGTLANNLQGLLTIVAFGRQEHEVARVEASSVRYREANREAILLSSAITPVIRMAVMFGFVAMLVVGGLQTLDGKLTAGAYSALVFLTQRLLWPLTRLAEVTDMYNRSIAAIGRALSLLDLPIHRRRGEGPVPAGPLGLRLVDVEFSYASSAPVLRKVSLELAAGKTTAIVGATGSGKSTLVKLLLKLYAPTDGRIEVGNGATYAPDIALPAPQTAGMTSAANDGEPAGAHGGLHDLAGLDEAAWRAAIGYVGQDVFLIDASIRDNIRYGRLDATDAEVEDAARAAGAHGFICALPRGYDTEVGERGQKLSGGQRQRIAIARALVRAPRILLFDEATSAVDNETERAITAALREVTRGQTTVLIAHRLSTILHAERIYVMDAGSVVEAGSHQQLIERGGVYAHLWALQTGALTRS